MAVAKQTQSEWMASVEQLYEMVTDKKLEGAMRDGAISFYVHGYEPFAAVTEMFKVGVATGQITLTAEEKAALAACGGA